MINLLFHSELDVRVPRVDIVEKYSGISRAVLEQVARNRVPVLKKNPRNENNQ